MQPKYKVAIVGTDMQNNIFQALINKKQQIRINLRQAQPSTLKKIEQKTKRIIASRQKNNYSTNQHRNLSKRQLQTVEKPNIQSKSLIFSRKTPSFLQVIQRSNNRLASIGWSEQSPLIRTSKMSRTYRRIKMAKHDSQQNIQKFMTIPFKYENNSQTNNLLSLVKLELDNKNIQPFWKNTSRSNRSSTLSPKKLKKEHQYQYNINNKQLSGRSNINSKSFFNNKNISQYIYNKIISSKDKIQRESRGNNIKNRSLSFQNIEKIKQNKLIHHLFIKNDNPFAEASSKKRIIIGHKRACSFFPNKKSSQYLQKYVKPLKPPKKQPKKDDDAIINKIKSKDESPDSCRPWSVSINAKAKAQFNNQNIQGKISFSNKDEFQHYNNQKQAF